MKNAIYKPIFFFTNAQQHVKRFTDLLVRDIVTKQGYRADKLLDEVK
jgi:glycyl-tRNA synthetase (class II)